MSFGVSAMLSSSDRSMNDEGEGAGDIGEDLDDCAREDLLEKIDRWSGSRTLSPSSRPHIAEVLVGDKGVECLRPLTFKYTVSSGGGQTPLSLGCNGFEIDAIARCPFRTSGESSDRCNGETPGLNEVRSGPGV